jgi:hypothetical protein
VTGHASGFNTDDRIVNSTWEKDFLDIAEPFIVAGSAIDHTTCGDGFLRDSGLRSIKAVIAPEPFAEWQTAQAGRMPSSESQRLKASAA